MLESILSPEEDQVVREGLQAEALLANEAFSSTMKTLIYERFCDFTDTKAIDATARELIYNQMQGLQAIEAELNARVQRKDVIERRLNATPDEDIDLPI